MSYKDIFTISSPFFVTKMQVRLIGRKQIYTAGRLGSHPPFLQQSTTVQGEHSE